MTDAVQLVQLGTLTSSVSSGTVTSRDERGHFPLYGSTGAIGHTFEGKYQGDAVLVARVGANAGSVYRVSGQYGVTDNTLIVRPGKELNVYYLEQCLAHLDLNRQVYGSGQPLITGRILKSLDLPLRGLLEQEAISAALLDVDMLIASLEQVIAKKRAIKQGIMQELLTGQTRLPGFREQWRAIRLGDHVSYVKNAVLSRAQLDSSSPLRYLHYGDIHTRDASVLDASAEEMPRAPRSLAGSAGLLQVGDLVFADASEDPAGVGRSVEITGVPVQGAIPGLHTIAARFDKRVLADGFKAYLQFMAAFREQLLTLAAGTKVLATTRAYISSVELTLPEVDEQLAIAEVLRDADREIAAFEGRVEATRAIKQGMMQELLTGRTQLAPSEVSV